MWSSINIKEVSVVSSCTNRRDICVYFTVDLVFENLSGSNHVEIGEIEGADLETSRILIQIRKLNIKGHKFNLEPA